MAIIITSSAIKKISNVASKDPQKKFFRLYITGGGCSGFQYGFRFEPTSQVGDHILEFENFTAVIDPITMQYVDESEIDFIEKLEGSKFKINNPNVKGTCSCGASFSI